MPESEGWKVWTQDGWRLLADIEREQRTMAESDLPKPRVEETWLQRRNKQAQRLAAYESLDLDALCWIVAAFEGDETVPSAEGNELYAKLSAIRESA